MKPSCLANTLVGLLILLAIVIVLHSATGGESISVALLALIFVLVALLASLFLSISRRRGGRTVLPVLTVAGLSFALIVSVLITHWPLRLSFGWSHNSFDAMARQVKAGEPVEGRRVGLLTIRRAEVYSNGVVCLWTDLDDAGKTGFVQCPPENPPFNLWSQVRLSERWQFITED